MTDRWQEFFENMKAVGLTPITLDDPAAMRQALEQASQAARYRALATAVLAYAHALEQCANDPDTMASYCTAQGDTLDSLFADMLRLATPVKHTDT